MGQIEWFNLKFEFNSAAVDYQSLVDRLASAPYELKSSVEGINEDLLVFKPDGKWSIKEHLGHLLLLEPRWKERFADIQEGLPTMRAVDLSNSGTDSANFNQTGYLDLWSSFWQERKRTLERLKCFSVHDLEKRSLHPRLLQTMNCCDLMLFVAEHDLHHLKAIQHLITTYD